MDRPAETDLIDRAAKALKRGRLVAFPTETVYGLGADATRAAAVRRIFRAKGRPSTNPLIVHVAGVMYAKRYAARWSHAARELAQAFWPGPLTLVVPKVAEIVPEVTAGLETVGLRMPDHPLALELLRKFGGPIAAPSANKSNHVSPTTAQHVRDEFGGEIDVILDGGACRVGIESTVLDLSGDVPTILRPGGVSREQIAGVIGKVELKKAGPVMRAVAGAPGQAMTSPGQLETHYAPRTPAFRFDSHQRDRIDLTDAAIIELTLDAAAYAHNFYARLRLLDQQNLRAIYIEMPPERPAWLAVRDRIMRATRPL